MQPYKISFQALQVRRIIPPFLFLIITVTAKEGVKEKEKPPKQEKKKPAKPKKPKAQPENSAAPAAAATTAAAAPKGQYAMSMECF